MKQFSEFNRDDNSLKYVRQIFNTFNWTSFSLDVRLISDHLMPLASHFNFPILTLSLSLSLSLSLALERFPPFLSLFS